LVESEYSPDLSYLTTGKAPVVDMLEWLKGHLFEETDRSVLIPLLMEEFKCSERTIESRLKQLVRIGENPPENWTREVILTKKRVENNTIYNLKEANKDD